MILFLCLLISYLQFVHAFENLWENIFLPHPELLLKELNIDLAMVYLVIFENLRYYK